MDGSLITIESAADDDLAPLLKLLERNGLPTEGFAAHLAHALVARHEGRLVGSAALEIYGDGALLRSVAVDSSLRGMGLGVRLTEAALARARELGAGDVYLLTETAGGYFPRFGFEPIARALVAPGVRQSVEFTTACAETAQAMRKEL